MRSMRFRLRGPAGRKGRGVQIVSSLDSRTFQRPDAGDLVHCAGRQFDRHGAAGAIPCEAYLVPGLQARDERLTAARHEEFLVVAHQSDFRAGGRRFAVVEHERDQCAAPRPHREGDFHGAAPARHDDLLDAVELGADWQLGRIEADAVVLERLQARQQGAPVLVGTRELAALDADADAGVARHLDQCEAVLHGARGEQPVVDRHHAALRTDAQRLLVDRGARVGRQEALAALVVETALAVGRAAARAAQHAPSGAGFRGEATARREVAFGLAVAVGEVARHVDAVVERHDEGHAHRRRRDDAVDVGRGEGEGTALADPRRVVEAVGVDPFLVPGLDPGNAGADAAEALGRVAVASGQLQPVGRVVGHPDPAVVPARAFRAQGDAVAQAAVLEAQQPLRAVAEIVAVAAGERGLSEHLPGQRDARAEAAAAGVRAQLAARLQGQRLVHAVAPQAGSEALAVVGAVDAEVAPYRARVRLQPRRARARSAG